VIAGSCRKSSQGEFEDTFLIEDESASGYSANANPRGVTAHQFNGHSIHMVSSFTRAHNCSPEGGVNSGETGEAHKDEPKLDNEYAERDEAQYFPAAASWKLSQSSTSTTETCARRDEGEDQEEEKDPLGGERVLPATQYSGENSQEMSATKDSSSRSKWNTDPLQLRKEFGKSSSCESKKRAGEECDLDCGIICGESSANRPTGECIPKATKLSGENSKVLRSEIVSENLKEYSGISGGAEEEEEDDEDVPCAYPMADKPDEFIPVEKYILRPRTGEWGEYIDGPSMNNFLDRPFGYSYLAAAAHERGVQSYTYPTSSGTLPTVSSEDGTRSSSTCDERPNEDDSNEGDDVAEDLWTLMYNRPLVPSPFAYDLDLVSDSTLDGGSCGAADLDPAWSAFQGERELEAMIREKKAMFESVRERLLTQQCSILKSLSVVHGDREAEGVDTGDSSATQDQSFSGLSGANIELLGSLVALSLPESSAPSWKTSSAQDLNSDSRRVCAAPLRSVGLLSSYLFLSSIDSYKYLL